MLPVILIVLIKIRWNRSWTTFRPEGSELTRRNRTGLSSSRGYGIRNGTDIVRQRVYNIGANIESKVGFMLAWTVLLQGEVHERSKSVVRCYVREACEQGRLEHGGEMHDDTLWAKGF